jgi:ATP-dependent RNA helicase RhlE
VLVFTRTKHGADKVVRSLDKDGITAAAIHGNKSQPQRERALAAFRDGSCRVLIATDIAARGIDVSGVSHVINFDLPNVAEQYVHRIGRTARAGAAGVAIAYCAEDERPYLKGIERLTKQLLTPVPLPEGFNAESARIKAARANSPIQIVERPEREERHGRGRPSKRFSARPARPQGESRSGGRRRYASR